MRKRRDAKEVEGMNIAVIGAAGSVGREIARQIVAERMLDRDQTLQLTGNPRGISARVLYGLAADFQDAYAEICPRMEVVLDPERLSADVIVMAAGSTIPLDLTQPQLQRGFLAERNSPIFHRYASVLAKNGRGSEIVICISNPNELAVAIFAKYLGRNRVIGMGAYLDSLRFRREIAADLGVRRQAVHGFMIGEHGDGVVPLWSGVHVHGFSAGELAKSLSRIRGAGSVERFPDDVKEARSAITELVRASRIEEAFRRIDQYPPDIRTALKPFVTHLSGAKTVTGTARAAVTFLQTILMGNDSLVSGQLALEGEFYGIHGTFGVPFVIGNQGVERIIRLAVAEDEKRLLLRNAESVQEKLKPYL
jgi:malate dehydrogenase